jgi:hypothetical protein
MLTWRPEGLGEAMRFLRAVRSDAALRERLAELDPLAGLAPVVAVAADAGYSLTVDALRCAHAHDWALRQMHYGGG